MARNDIAVIVSTYNRPKALNLVLGGLFRQTLRPAQVIVADDGSGPETKALIKEWQIRGFKIEHCWHEDRGFRKTVILNQAVARASSNLLVFLDGDCIPFPGFVRDHQRLSSAGVFCAGTRVLVSPGYTRQIEHQPDWQMPRSSWRWLGLWAGGMTNKAFPQLSLPDGCWRTFQANNWRLLRGCNFSVWADDILKIGGFDESIEGWGKEDSDVAVRLIHSGLKLKSLLFAARVLHLWHPEESRDRLKLNEQHLSRAISERRTMAVRGLGSAAPSRLDT